MIIFYIMKVTFSQVTYRVTLSLVNNNGGAILLDMDEALQV